MLCIAFFHAGIPRGRNNKNYYCSFLIFFVIYVFFFPHQTLILLINLVEHCDLNRKSIVEAKAPSDEESIFESKCSETKL